MTMCEKSSIIAKEIYNSLNAENKYIPTWFRYDKQGSIYNDICLTENQFYYMHRCEEEVLSGYAEEIVGRVSPPWTLVDMGSGNGVKTRKLLNVMTTKADDIVQYIPIDISEECLMEMACGMEKDYEGKVSVHPVAGDYSKGVQYLRGKTGNKLILWLGGLQGLPYEHQIQYISELADIMTDSDRLVVSLDFTQDKDQVEAAYGGLTDISTQLFHLNALHRLNRDFDSDIDVEKFSLEVNFVKNLAADEPSYARVQAIAQEHMEYKIPGLGMVLRLNKGDGIRLSDGKGISFKYTMDQVKYLAKASGTTLVDTWFDKEKHVGICAFKICH